MDENTSTDAIAASMAQQLSPNPPPKRTCECCGEIYKTPDEARFSRLITNGKTYLVCGECIMFLWHHKNWAGQEKLGLKGRWLSWLRR